MCACVCVIEFGSKALGVCVCSEGLEWLCVKTDWSGLFECDWSCLSERALSVIGQVCLHWTNLHERKGDSTAATTN